MTSPPRQRRRSAIAALLLAVAVAACQPPLSRAPAQPPERELAATPQVLDQAEQPPPLEAEPSPTTGTDAPQDDGGAGAAPTPTTPPATGGSATDGSGPSPPSTENASPPPPAPSGFRVVGNVTDPRNDHGLEGPGYADLVAVTIEDDGANARISVDVAADFPARLGDGEVMGVGVDLFRDRAQQDSDFQLFADGGPDGWLAFLSTPEGFSEYPGAFRIGGRRLVFEVPWPSLGDLRAGAFGAFLDWSQARPAVNAVAEDRAPDPGTAPFAR